MDNSDNFRGRGNARRQAKRAAKRSGRASGMSRKAARKFGRGQGRLAKRTVKSSQLRTKARAKGGKRGAKIMNRAARVIGRGTTSGAKITLQNAAVAPLLPFRGAMQKALSDKGKFNKGMSFPNVVNAFYNTFVSKRNYESSSYQAISDNYLDNDQSANLYVDELNQEEKDHFGAAIGTIVSAIIGFFKKMKEKKLARKSANKTEKELGDATIKVEGDLKQELKDGEPITRGDFKGLKGKERRAMKKLYKEQQPQKAGLFSGLGDILGGDEGKKLVGSLFGGKKDQQGVRDVEYSDSGDNSGMIKKVIGIVIFIALAYIIFKKVS